MDVEGIAARFDRRRLILEFITRENVSISREDNLFSHVDDPFESPRFCMRFRIGAFCEAEVDFVQLGSQPEAATVSLVTGDYQVVYDAAGSTERQIAEETIAAARAYRYLVFTANEKMRIASGAPMGSPRIRCGIEQTGKEHVDIDGVFEPFPDDAAGDEGASRTVGGAIRRAALGKRRPLPMGADARCTIAYEDASWDEGAFRGHDRPLMAPIAEVLEAWPEAFPEFSVIGCGDSRIRYEHAGHEGELYFDWDDETRWWNGKQTTGLRYSADLGFEPRGASGYWHGRVQADLPSRGTYLAEELPKIARYVLGCAESFRASVRSLVEAPIVCDECDFSSSYRNTWGTRRVYYPASCARDVERALWGCDVIQPIDLARAITEGTALSTYVQRDYEEQHDVEYLLDNVSYDAGAGVLSFDFTTTECPNIDRFPTCFDKKRMRVSGLAPERVRMVAQLEPEPEQPLDPSSIEWTIRDRDLPDGSVEMWAVEFPDIVETAESPFDAYHRLYDRIYQHLQELQATGKPIPTPLSAVERERLRKTV